MRRLSALDAQFLAAESGNFGAQYCGLAIYETGPDRPITAATMSARLRERIDRCPPLRWKVVTVPLNLDHPVFVDGDVDVDEHVHEITLPEPADDSVLADTVAEIMANRLDRSRPLWAMYVVHGLAGRTAVVTKLHHAISDGISAAHIYAAILDGAVPSADEGSRHTDEPNQFLLAARGIIVGPLRRVKALRHARGSLANLDQVPVLRSLPGVQTVSQMARLDLNAARLDAPRTRFNSGLSAGRSVAWTTVPLQDVKDIKNAAGVTVNDVVIALCAGALRRRLAATGELTSTPLVAYNPVSVRSPESTDRFGNAISSIVAPIPTHLADARERLAFAHETLKRAKVRTQQASPTLLEDVNVPIPAPVFGVAARGLLRLISSPLVRPPVNLIISNVPGPPMQQTCLGAPLLAHYPLSVVFDGFTLNITVVSYDDGLDIGIVGDSASLPDGWELIDEFHDELADLLALVTECSDDALSAE
ncbi:MAG: wax ester/triacylglycerol synthase family O-acyltransferase [Mycobacterium kyogaense]|uniref:wax ester/triacylglycerol synthase family O-acyltransferase n=1 Tax=Mycobacterium kyogaense TaxID=2212479 RepID=UPI002FFA7A46